MLPFFGNILLTYVTEEENMSISRSDAVAKRLFLFLIVGFVILTCIFCMSACDDDAATDAVITLVLNNGDADIYWKKGDPEPDIERYGYAFLGWFYDEGLTEPIKNSLSECELNNGARLFAKWSKLKTFENILFEDTSVVYDGEFHSVTLEGVPEDSDIEYDGEYSFSNAGVYEINVTIKKDGYCDLSLSATLTIVKAKAPEFTMSDTNINWDGQAKSIFVNETVPDDIKVTYIGNGQADVGVYTVTAKFDGGGNYEDIADVSATLSIVYGQVSVIFVDADGERIEKKVVYGTGLSDIPSPKPIDGYSVEWDRTDFENIRENIEVKVVVKLAIYSIDYELNGGILDDKITSYDILDETFDLPVPYREHYVFDGWYESRLFLGNAITQIAKGSFGDVTLFAKWSPVEYGIEYVLGDDDSVTNVDNPESYDIESESIVLANAVRRHYVFDGWFSDSEYRHKVEIIEKGSNGDIVLYAKWTAQKYTVTYMLNGGDGCDDPIEYSVENDNIVLGTPTRRHFDFVGWYSNSDLSGQAVEIIVTALGRDITLYAAWSPTVYTITYNVADGENSKDNPSRLTINDCPFALCDAVRVDGSEFLRWYYLKDGAPITVTEITQDNLRNYELYAEFDLIQNYFTVENINGVNTLTDYDITGGENVVVPADLNIKRIAKSAFGGMDSIVSIKIEEGVEEIEDGVFDGCVSLTEAVLPSSVKRMPKALFADCVRLEKLTVPFIGEVEYDPARENIYYPFGYIFADTQTENCVRVESRSIEVMDGGNTRTSKVEYFVPSSLKSVTVLSNTVQNYAFFNCVEIVTVDISRATSIGVAAFAYCTSLKSLTVSSIIDTVAESAFNGGVAIDEVYFCGTAQEWDIVRSRFPETFTAMDCVIRCLNEN